MQLDDLIKEKCIAITGGIATGKSAVGSILSSLGYVVYDADLFSRRVIEEKKEIFLKIINEFGSGILNEKNRVDRKKLSKIIFMDSYKRNKLEEILHPEIHKYFMSELKVSSLFETPQFFFYEASLVYEAKIEGIFREVWVTYCSQKVQIERLIKRNNLSLNYAKDIIRTQLCSQVKRERAKFAINTEQSNILVRKQIQKYLLQNKI